MREIAGKLRAYIQEVFLFGDDLDYDDDASLMQAGIIDSVGVLELVSYIEEEFGIEVEDDELVPANFDSLANIADYLGRKLA